MSKPAYDKIYLDSMKKKTEYLFVLIARNCPEVFETITLYMECEYRKKMDRGNPFYLNKTPKQILGSLGISVNPKLGISEQYDEFIMEWMADIYTCMQWKYNIPSAEIVDAITPQKLYEIYYPLHEASLENGIEKLMKIYLSDNL